MKNELTTIINCTSSNNKILEKAKVCATNLGLYYSQLPVKEYYPFALTFTDTQLELHSYERSLKKPIIITVDFIKGRTGYRVHNDLKISQPLAKAVGIKSGFRPDVVDATAGLGQDGYLLASLGCKVTMIEKSKIIFLLLDDAITRMKNHKKASLTLQPDITLINNDSTEVLQHLEKKPHTIYLDPMYPQRNNSAATKKEMTTLRKIVGKDQDSETLLKTALQTCSNRVVVKRPENAPVLTNDIKPSHVITMKKHRFDVYLSIHL